MNYMWSLCLTKPQIGISHRTFQADTDHEIHFSVINGIGRVAQ